jgi:hypothetical protein
MKRRWLGDSPKNTSNNDQLKISKFFHAIPNTELSNIVGSNKHLTSLKVLSVKAKNSLKWY